MVLPTAAVSCGSQSVLSTMGAAKWIFGIILRQIAVPNQYLRSICAKNVRQMLFESLFCAEDLSEIHPQIHPGKNVQADENIEIFVAPSASRVCIQHLI
jgi:hypothetical protein